MSFSLFSVIISRRKCAREGDNFFFCFIAGSLYGRLFLRYCGSEKSGISAAFICFRFSPDRPRLDGLVFQSDAIKRYTVRTGVFHSRKRHVHYEENSKQLLPFSSSRYFRNIDNVPRVSLFLPLRRFASFITSSACMPFFSLSLCIIHSSYFFSFTASHFSDSSLACLQRLHLRSAIRWTSGKERIL